MSSAAKKRKFIKESLYNNEDKFLDEFPSHIALADDVATRSQFVAWIKSGHVKYCIAAHVGLRIDEFPAEMTNMAYLAAPVWVAYHKVHDCLKRADLAQPNVYLK